MKAERFIGKTVGELAKETGMFWDKIRVFVLSEENDDTGKHLMDAYSLRQVVNAYPSAACATVASASNFYGETILRVKI